MTSRSEPLAEPVPVAESDLGSATDEYAARFSGPVGRWMLETQEAAILPAVRKHPAGSALDVGGAHAQLAVPLARSGWQVTVTGSVPECESWLRKRTGDMAVSFALASSLRLPFEDRSFEWVLAVRMMTHSADWPRLVGELCRVARRGVIVDYPTRSSLNCLSGALFGLKRKIETNTRAYTLFRDRDIEAAFREQGFRVAERQPEFFWPMALHRLVRSLPVSRLLETATRRAGLTRRWGSPVVLRAERTETEPPPADSG